MTKRYLITGGAGFIGCNYAHRVLTRGEQVTVYDNLSRPRTEANVAWLRERHGEEAFRLIVGDVQDDTTLAEATRGADRVFVEFYTSRMGGADREGLERRLGRPVEVLKREDVEQRADRIVETAAAGGRCRRSSTRASWPRLAPA